VDSWSKEKTCPLSKCQKYLGFFWDLEAKTVSLTDKKLEKVRKTLNNWRNEQMKFTAKEALGLHRQLVHISCIFPIVRPFLQSTIMFANSFQSPQSHLFPPSMLCHDLNWISFLLDHLPNIQPLMVSTPQDIGW
jgi:hypothetical protein